MLLLILGLFDVLIGFCLLKPVFFSLIVFWVGLGASLKGIYSLVAGYYRKFLCVLGIIDVIGGLSLLLEFNIPYLWVLFLVKGIYSIISWGK